MIKTHIPARPRNKKIVPTGGSSTAPIVSSGGSSHSHSNKHVIDQLTQVNIDVLSYLSLYQTGVEMGVLLDEFGDPVLDVNGDPVTETIPVYAIKSSASFFSEKEVSTYGLGEEGDGGGGGGESYDMLLSWANYTEEKSNWVISAALGKGLHDRVTTLEAGGVGGSVAWADITDKPSTFTPSAHTHSAGDIASGTFAIARIPTGTTGTTVALGNHLHTGVYEPVFSKNTAFNKDFGSTSGTVAEGNDSRINNGQTAYSWGNHASAGYALNSDFNTHNTDNVRHITGAERTKWDGVVTDFGDLEIGGINYVVLKTIQKGYIDHTNGIFVANIAHGATDYIPLTANTVYTLSASKSLYYPRFAFYNASKVFISGYLVNLYQVLPYQPIIPANAAFIRFSTDINTGPMPESWKFEKGNKPTDWTPAPEDQVSDWNTTDVNSFSFIKNKPTTLSGYGITDAVTLNTEQTITGAKTFSAALTASISVATPKVIFNSAGWSMEQTGTELLLKYNNLIAARFLSDGSIVGLGEITAYGSSTGGEGVALLRTGGTMTGNLTMSADIIMNSGRAIGVSNLPLKLLGNALTYNASNVLTEANTATQIKMGNGWTIEQTTSALTIKKNGVVKGTFNA